MEVAAPISIDVSVSIDAPVEAIFDAWLDAESAAQWLFATPSGVMEKVEIAPRVGGGFDIVERRGDVLASHFGTYVEIDRPFCLVFDFSTGVEERPTRVTMTIESQTGGSVVTLRHTLDPKWAAYEEQTRAGWLGILNGLARSLAGGAEGR
jgi:uncharacterized protein YndB with AHSA1/START domain